VTGEAVAGGTVVGGTVVGGTVVGGTVVGGTVVGGTVVGGIVVGGTVVGATVVGVVSGVGVGVVALAVGVLLVLPAAGVVGVVPGAELDGCRTGPTVVPVPVVGGLTRALMIGESPVTLPDRLVEPPIAFGLALACAAAGDSIGSDAAEQSAALQAMNPLDELPDWDAPIPYQQMSVMAPSTPVPITRFRTECGRCKSSSFGCCRYNDFPPLFMAVSYCLEAFGSLSCEN
jgi:hypothetical protein